MRASSARSHHSSAARRAGVIRRREAAAQDDAVALQRQQGSVDVRFGDADCRGERGCRDWSFDGEAAPDDLGQRGCARPVVRAACDRDGQSTGSSTTPGCTASHSGSRSAATSSPSSGSDAERTRTRVARLEVVRLSTHAGAMDRRSVRVRNPTVISASCSSSASRGSGRASSRTLAIAAASSAPVSSTSPARPARRVCTACVRRSSSGASSRKAYGRAFRMS